MGKLLWVSLTFSVWLLSWLMCTPTLGSFPPRFSAPFGLHLPAHSSPTFLCSFCFEKRENSNRQMVAWDSWTALRAGYVSGWGVNSEMRADRGSWQRNAEWTDSLEVVCLSFLATLFLWCYFFTPFPLRITYQYIAHAHTQRVFVPTFIVKCERSATKGENYKMKSSVDRLLRVCLLMSLSGSPCSNGEETEGDWGRQWRFNCWYLFKYYSGIVLFITACSSSLLFSNTTLRLQWLQSKANADFNVVTVPLFSSLNTCLKFDNAYNAVINSAICNRMVWIKTFSLVEGTISLRWDCCQISVLKPLLLKSSKTSI